MHAGFCRYPMHPLVMGLNRELIDHQPIDRYTNAHDTGGQGREETIVHTGAFAAPRAVATDDEAGHQDDLEVVLVNDGMPVARFKEAKRVTFQSRLIEIVKRERSISMYTRYNNPAAMKCMYLRQVDLVVHGEVGRHNTVQRRPRLKRSNNLCGRRSDIDPLGPGAPFLLGRWSRHRPDSRRTEDLLR